jgi:hypothetical protein
MSNDNDKIVKERSNFRGVLPIWARELLAMKDEAEGKSRVLESSAREGS